MYPLTGLALCLCSGYTCSHLNEPTRAASLTQMAPGSWVSFPTYQVVSSSPTCTCQGEHAKPEREEEGAPPPQGNTAPAVQSCIAGRLFLRLLAPTMPCRRRSCLSQLGPKFDPWTAGNIATRLLITGHRCLKSAAILGSRPPRRPHSSICGDALGGLQLGSHRGQSAHILLGTQGNNPHEFRA
jgi:hypothetical protein